MMTREERTYKEREFGEVFQEKIKELRLKYPKHNYDILSQLAQMLYPRLFAAANGEFSDNFDARAYAEEPEQPEFESAADELAHRAKIYSLRKDTDYETAQKAILSVDEDLAERYKME